jgi:hypothetical protein
VFNSIISLASSQSGGYTPIRTYSNNSRLGLLLVVSQARIENHNYNLLVSDLGSYR